MWFLFAFSFFLLLQLHFIYKIAGESKTRREESGGVLGEGEGETEKERESARMHAGESMKKHFGSSFYMFFRVLDKLCYSS